MLLVAIISVLAPLQWLAALPGDVRFAAWFPRTFYRLACRLMGIVVDVHGSMHGGQTVWVANHLSYLDILAIGSLAKCSFVAKDDVGTWPILGRLARLWGTVFISRVSRRAADVGKSLASALATGRSLVVFPEGTTSDGTTVLPFKSSLFETFVADPAASRITLQPLTVSVTSIDDHAVDVSNRDVYAYHGDASLGPHLLRFLGTSGAHVRLTFHAPLPRQPGDSRKSLATAAHAAVVGGLVGCA
ncbi:MAG: lysophospholipid acyltransferase family protein [Luteimonas sp.]